MVKTWRDKRSSIPLRPWLSAFNRDPDKQRSQIVKYPLLYSTALAGPRVRLQAPAELPRILQQASRLCEATTRVPPRRATAAAVSRREGFQSGCVRGSVCALTWQTARWAHLTCLDAVVEMGNGPQGGVWRYCADVCRSGTLSSGLPSSGLSLGPWGLRFEGQKRCFCCREC